MDERLKKLLGMELVEICPRSDTLVLVFKKKDSEERVQVQLTVRETGGIGADGGWYTYPAVDLDGKEVWHG